MRERDQRVRGLVDLYFDAVWRCLRRFGVPADAVDDAAQQVFIVTTRRLDEIRRGEERAYLFGIALRVASDARRARCRREAVERCEEADGEDPVSLPDELVDRKRARELLDRVLEEMTLDLRSVFVLFELEGMSAPEIGAALGLPVGTVSSRLRRARALFQQAVDALGVGDGEGHE